MFDAILFDFDGVLADTEPVHFECWREVLSGFGIHLEWSGFQREFVGVSDWEMLERLGSARKPPISAEELWPSYSRKRELFQARILAQPPFQQSTIDLVRELHGEYKLAVVSSSHREEIEPPLARAGILPLLGALVCGNEVQNLKPAPEPYLRAAELLGASQPLVIEDSDPGVASGRAAGFEVLRVPNASALVASLGEYLRKDSSDAQRNTA